MRVDARVLALVLSFSIALAQESAEMEIKPEFGLYTVAGKCGVAYIVDGYGVNPGFGVWADLGRLADMLKIDGGVEFWSGKKQETAQTIKLSNLAIYLTLRLDFPVDNWCPFVGAGLGVDMYTKKPEHGAEEKRSPLEPHIDLGTRYDIHPKIDIEARIKANFSDWSAYGLYISGVFKLEKIDEN